MAAKPFAVGDVLPATTQLRITVDFNDMEEDDEIHFCTTNDYIEGHATLMPSDDSSLIVNGYDITLTSSQNKIHIYDLDTSSLTEEQRTVTHVYGDGSGKGFWTWEDLNAPTGFSITFEENGGSEQTDLSGQTNLPNPLPIPTKSGYTFGGWYYDSDFTNEAFAGDPLTGDVTLYAKWEEISLGYTITFDSNGGSIIPQTSNVTQLPDPLPTPTKKGYTFVAWYYESNFQTRAKAGDTIEANTTLYAKWHNLGSLFTEIANAIREKESSSETIRDVDFGDRIRDLEVGGAELPSTAGGSIFTGATIPLTYKNNTHDYENNYEYKSATHNITITGLDGRATITGNGTKNVLVAFDVTSSTTSLKNFTITCVNEEQELTYKGLHAHYGETVTGILTFAYNNITHDGSEGTFDTGGLTANYKFIVTSSSDLPIFSSNEVLWNTIYSHQLLNVLIGNFSGTSIGDYFMSSCYTFNQPLTLPSGLSSIGNNFMYYCYTFNQPLTLPSGLSSIGNNFMYYCYTFNQPLTLPSGLSSIGDYFMSNCCAFNQPLTLPSSLSSIGFRFMYSCYAFNQVLTLPSGLSSIGDYFMSSCFAFNQPLTLPSGLSSIGDYFMSNCRSFNQVLTLPSSLSSIGDNFMSNCYPLSTIIWNASVYPTDNNSLSQGINTKTNSTYGAGIKVYGTKRAELISALPNRTLNPHRKLINGGS